MSAQNRNGIILIGAILAVAAVVGIWRTASAQETCGAIADPYGAAPGNLEYRQPDVGQEEEIIKRANLQDYERYGLEVRLVFRGDELAGALYSLTSLEDADRDQLEDEFDKLGGSKRSIGGDDVREVAIDDGQMIAGMKDGCYGMVVVGADRGTVGTIADAVFKD